MKALSRLVAITGFAAGAALCYFAWSHIVTGVVPQVTHSGFSLTADNMVLNRNWHGNQLYLLVLLYLAVGIALFVGAARLWRGLGGGTSR